MIATRLTSPQLLAAFCQISDISAQCVGSSKAPSPYCAIWMATVEAAARGYHQVVAGMPVIA